MDNLKKQQSADLQQFEKQRVSLTDTAGSLAERYEDVCEENEQIVARWVSLNGFSKV